MTERPGIHVDERGHGEAVVLLHGSPTPPEYMAPLAERLAPRFRTFLFHLPGYGRSGPLDPYDHDQVHARIEEALIERGFTAAHFVGFSFGVYRTAAIVARGRIRPLTIVALSGYVDLTIEEHAGLVALLSALRQGADLHATFEQVMLSPRGRTDPANVARVRAWLDAISTENLLAEAQLVADGPEDLRAAIAAVDVPLLARVGEVDRAAVPGMSARIVAAARYGRLELVPGVGHALLYEDLDGTVAAVEAHLTAVR